MRVSIKERMLVLERLGKLGIDYDEAQALRRISMTLRRWSELECGDGHGIIERDEETGKPYYYRCNHSYVDPNDPRARYCIADREKGALKRLQTIMSKHPDLLAYHQTDPRGCAIYVLRKDDVPVGSSIDSMYNRGIAVY